MLHTHSYVFLLLVRVHQRNLIISMLLVFGKLSIDVFYIQDTGMKFRDMGLAASKKAHIAELKVEKFLINQLSIFKLTIVAVN